MERSQVNFLIGGALDDAMERTAEPPRQYLGASAIGKDCSLPAQLQLMGVQPDKPVSARQKRIFEAGHFIEQYMAGLIRAMGITLRTERRGDGKEQLGFSRDGGAFRGHVDGVIEAWGDALAPHGFGTPALWESKSMNARNFKLFVKDGLSAFHSYKCQIALYQAYMEEHFPGISANPALLSVYDKNAQQVYFDLVPFDPALAQIASDSAYQIIADTRGRSLLPQAGASEEAFVCRFCNYKRQCWYERGALMERLRTMEINL